MTELIDKLLSAALRANISLFDFWNMTIKEVQMVSEAFIDNKRNEDRILKSTIYNQSYLTAMFVGQILGGKKPSSIEDIFPDLAVEDVQGKSQAEIEASIIRDKFMDFARKANEQRKNRRE